MSKERFTIQAGTLLPIYAVVGCYLLLVAGLYQFWEVSMLIGGLLILIGLLGAFARVGVQFDRSRDAFRGFTEILFIKSGEWLRLSDYPDLVVTRRNIRGNTNVGLVNFGSTVKSYYDVHMVNRSHLKKVTVGRYNSKEEAEAAAPKLAEQLQLNYTEFNPQVSQRSRRRR